MNNNKILYMSSQRYEYFLHLFFNENINLKIDKKFINIYEIYKGITNVILKNYNIKNSIYLLNNIIDENDIITKLILYKLYIKYN